MKLFKLLFLSIVIVGCHQGMDEARKTIRTNKEYKTQKKEFSVNRDDTTFLEINPIK